jgi:hypothetical protein
MTRWIWGAVVLASGCVIVEDDDKTDTGGNTDDTDTGDTEIPDPDDDGDGVTVGDGDCNDADPAINPNALEVCDTIDNNCDNGIDDAAAVTIGTTNYATVDEAVAAAAEGDVLLACPGTWTVTSLNVNTAVTLQAVSGRDVTTLSEVAGAAIATVGGSGVLTVDGFTLTGSVSSAFVLNDSATLNLKNSRVTANGRGIELVGDPLVTVAIEGTDIDNNAAGNGDGGGILALGVFDISLAQSNISANTAANGGGIFASVGFAEAPTINLVESNIDGNAASIGGGVVLQNVRLTGDGLSAVSNNTADTAGGGVALNKGAMESILVSSNDAPAGGGVAALYDVFFIVAPLGNEMASVIIDSNTATLGAGIWVDDDEPLSLDATSAVTVNTAAETGGGAYLDGNNSTLSSDGADFGAAGVNDNAPDDIYTGAGTFTFEPGAVFTCDGNQGCEEVVP